MSSKRIHSVSDDWRNSVQDSYLETITADNSFPVNTDDNRGSLNFNVRAVPGLVIDCKNLFLSFTYCVHKLQAVVDGDVETYNWEPVTITDYIAPYNGFGFAVFEVSFY